MANTNKKYNPSADQVSKPGLKQANGNWLDESRSHVQSGPQKTQKPPRKR